MGRDAGAADTWVAAPRPVPPDIGLRERATSPQKSAVADFDFDAQIGNSRFAGGEAFAFLETAAWKTALLTEAMRRHGRPCAGHPRWAVLEDLGA